MRWLVAAGGTGGHVFPAMSIALTLRKRTEDANILFIGTHRGLESQLVPARGFRLIKVRAYGFVGLSRRGQVRTLISIPWALFHCLVILAVFRPHVVLGMGGYVAGPVMFLAAVLGFNTAIAEQNAVAGRTNRILGRFVRRVFVSFSEAAGYFPRRSVRVTGNPVRPELISAAGRGEPNYWQGDDSRGFHLLVFGGSQGAHGLNVFMVEALPWLEVFPFRFEVLHQTGERQFEQLHQSYEASHIEHRVVTFVEDMEEAYEWSHLILCRAGATSLAEIALFGKPSVLVPYPYAADHHQRRNAQIFESAGAAVVLEEIGLSGRRLARIIRDLADDPQRMKEMGVKARELARPEAADRIIEECLSFVSGGTSHG